MVKRVVAAAAWFYATNSLLHGLSLGSDWPAGAGIPIAALVAVIVWIDPLRILSLGRATQTPSVERRAIIEAVDSPA